MPDLTSAFDFADNTYIAKEQSFAVIEVGDSKQKDAFYPQIKLMRWDNEVNFSVRLVSDEVAPTDSLVAEKIEWVGEALDAHFYQIGEGKEGDGFEFEIILKEPPKSNVISMTLQTKGLEFFYQPFMENINPDGSFWEDNIFGGRSECPANVGGSYAIYHSTAAGDVSALGGHNYKTGKFCHIYRPKMIDAAGSWVWGDLNIDTKVGLLTVTIPQDFLDKAVYPVRHAAGLTFGYDHIGASTNPSNTKQLLLTKSYAGDSAPGTPASSGTLTKISCYCDLIDAGATFDTAIYSDSSGPSARLAYVNPGGGGAVGASFAWVDTAISTSITASTQYWLGLAGPNGTTPNLNYKYDSVANQVSYNNNLTAWPDPWSGSLYSYRISIYATYTAAGGLSIPVAMQHYKQQRRN